MDIIKPANKPHFTISIKSVSVPLRVVEFIGEEMISSPFHYSIHLESDKTDIKPQDVVDSQAVFTFANKQHERSVSGIITRFEHSGSSREFGQYQAELCPDLYRLSQVRQCRIFQDKSVKDILKLVLDSAGLASSDYRFELSASYDKLEYCVQYRETDLDFFNRMAERFGIHYFFETPASSKKTCLVIADSGNAHKAVANPGHLLFSPEGPVENADYAHELNRAYALRPSKLSLKDFHFITPHLDLSAANTAEKDHTLEWYDYPGVYSTRAAGSTLAQVRREAEDCVRHSYLGKTDSARLLPGFTFKLKNHAIKDLNDEYLVTSVVHSGAQPTADNASFGELGYSNEFRCLPVKYPFRPQYRTPKPSVRGCQTAIVSGVSGNEIYSEQHGRVKVRFHWDRSKSSNDQSSCWIRVAQIWAGKGWGAQFIPRIGQEVVVDFLEGDPDQPIIIGSVYNGANPPPYALPGEQTKSTIKSETSQGGNGSNELRFEDAKGSEEIYIHAQKDTKIVTENDKEQSTGHNESLSIGKNRTKSVGADEQVSVSGNRTESVDKDESITISKNRTESVGKDESISIGDNRTLSIGKDSSCDIGANANISVAKDRTESIGKKQSLTVGDDMVVSVAKKYGINVSKSMSVNAADEIVLKCGSASISMKKNGDITIKGGKINIKGSGDVVIKGSKVTQN